ncbi:hypothetical protein Q5O14_16540 [Eubacteriaceae bacterium ES2]|nr:hypothetical protein Q5O14_16540 [Eubacteriaceae bacterium ES2]
MNYQIAREFPHPILEKQGKPVVSIYIDTNTRVPERFENPIRFKNLVKEVQRSLDDNRNFKDLFDLFGAMENDSLFWDYVSEGVAILADEEECVVYKLPMDVPNQAIVSDSFYTKPLLKSYQSSGLYHVLGLNRDSFYFFEADKTQIYQIPVDEKDSTLVGVLGKEKTEPHFTAGSYGGDQSVYHGHGGAKDEKNLDRDKFFHYVDNFILEQYSNSFKIPLILIGLDEHQGEFRKISKNPYLIKEGVKIDVDAVDIKSLHQKVQKVMKDLFDQQIKEQMDIFFEAQAKDLGSDDMIQIGKAISQGKIARLFLNGSSVHPGKFDPVLGSVQEDDLLSPYIGDVYDAMAEAVLSRGGDVMILERVDMPTGSDIAAIYRY